MGIPLNSEGFINISSFKGLLETKMQSKKRLIYSKKHKQFILDEKNDYQVVFLKTHSQ